MALTLKDRVQQTGTANTTVSFTLSGSVSGFQSFAIIGDGNTTYYAATDTSGNWEVGLGTYSIGATGATQAAGPNTGSWTTNGSLVGSNITWYSASDTGYTAGDYVLLFDQTSGSSFFYFGQITSILFAGGFGYAFAADINSSGGTPNGDPSSSWIMQESTGTTLTRTTILSSSNLNTPVTFSGAVNVFVTYPAESVPSGATPTVAGIVYGKSSDSVFVCCVGYVGGQTTLGYNAGLTNQLYQSVAIGFEAGKTNQAEKSVAVGSGAGKSCQSYYSVAVGNFAGANSQCNFATAVGNFAGANNQSYFTVAIGSSAAQNNQCIGAIAIGASSGYGQGAYAIAIGRGAGGYVCCVGGQAACSIAIGKCVAAPAAGLFISPIRNSTCTGGSPVGLGYCTTSKEIVYGVGGGGGGTCATPTVAGIVYGKSSNFTFGCCGPIGGQAVLGYNAGLTSQGFNSVAIGINAAQCTQGYNSIAIGRAAGQVLQGAAAVAIGNGAGGYTQGVNSVAIGNFSGSGCLGNYAIAIGTGSGGTACSIAIGTCVFASNAGLYISPIRNSTFTGGSPVGLGYCTTSKEIVYGVGGGASCATPTAAGIVYGRTSTGCFPKTALGYNAGLTCQNNCTTAIGNNAGQNIQCYGAVAVGVSAGNCNQKGGATAVGQGAGATVQCSNAVAVGSSAGNLYQGARAVAVGPGAGSTLQGTYAIAIGSCAGQSCQAANSIAIGKCVAAPNAGLYISPIRNLTGTTYLGYCSTSKEITYSAGAPSDINLKENIQPIGCALKKTAQIRGVTFDWKKCGAPSIGVIAQELEQVFPEMVTLEGDGYKTVKYDNMVAVLVEAVKELKVRVEALESLNK